MRPSIRRQNEAAARGERSSSFRKRSENPFAPSRARFLRAVSRGCLGESRQSRKRESRCGGGAGDAQPSRLDARPTPPRGQAVRGHDDQAPKRKASVRSTGAAPHCGAKLVHNPHRIRPSSGCKDIKIHPLDFLKRLNEVLPAFLILLGHGTFAGDGVTALVGYLKRTVYTRSL